MATPAEILAQYVKLTVWCERYFVSIQEQFTDDIVCRPGCNGCCKLSSISAIEAIVIYQNIHQSIAHRNRLKTAIRHRRGYCPFLENKRCTVYPVRPLICRTHGAPIRSGDHYKTDCCPLNFSHSDISNLPENKVLDIDIINQNLARLNSALSMVLSEKRVLLRRYSMADIYADRIPRYLKRIAESLF